MDDYPYKIVVAEGGSCKCGHTHEEGEPVFGSMQSFAQLERLGVDAVERNEDKHSVPLKRVSKSKFLDGR